MRSDDSIDRRARAGLALYSLVVAAAFVIAGVHSDRLDGSLTGLGIREALTVGSTSLTYDDGFYYLKIAEEIARGRGSTFDGLHPTNGYHPLWLLCLVPIFWLTSAIDIALILAVLLQAILMAIGVDLTYRIARNDLSRSGAILAALLWVHVQLLYRLPLSGLEYSLNGACILAVVHCYRTRFSDGPAAWTAHLALGALLSLAFLARLDNILFFGCLFTVLGVEELRGGPTMAGARRLLALGVPPLAAVLSYMVVNVHFFGHLLPINGFIKRDWSVQLLYDDPHYQANGWMAAKLVNGVWPVGHMKHAYVLFLAAGSVGAPAAWLWSVLHATGGPRPARAEEPVVAGATRPRVSSRFPWGPVVLFGVLQVSLYGFAFHDGYSFQRWYYVIQPWFGAMLLAAIGETAARRASRALGSPSGSSRAYLFSSAACCGVLLASARTLTQWRKEALLGFSREPLYAAAQWVRANVPNDARVGAWNAGTIGYLSGRSAVNLDGLVNSWDFYQTKRHDLCAYWRESGVTYLVDTFELGREPDFFRSFVGPDPSCVSKIGRVWIGPAYAHTSQYAEAFRVR